MGSLSDRYRERMALAGMDPDESWARELDVVSAKEESAAAGKVSFNVTASVRYPTQEEELQRLRDEGAVRAAESMRKLNDFINTLGASLFVAPEAKGWKIDYVENVGLEVTTDEGERYNVTVTEGF